MFAASKTASVSGGYQIQRSLRFNSADSAYLNRTPASATNQKTFTFSFWIKRTQDTGTKYVFSANSDSNATNAFGINFYPNFEVFQNSGGSAVLDLISTAVYRDVSAWYHCVIAIDTTQATASNRALMYVNGVQVTSLSTATYPSQNTNLSVNSVIAHYIGRLGYTTTAMTNDYLTEFYFIDGQALTPSSFGETNAQTGVWQPKAYSGSYGTNGFYLNFSDNSNTTAATLGKDYSGNGNNWTPNNFSVTAGAGNDSLVDSPTSYGTDTGVGGEVRGNYCTANPLDKASSITLSNGNIDYAVPNGTQTSFRSTFGISSGKWYWEVTPTGGLTPSDCLFGLSKSSANINSYVGVDANGWSYYGANGQKANNGTFTAYGSSFTTNNVIGVAFDADAGTLTFYKNGTSQGTAFSGLTSGPYFPAFGGDGVNGSLNFGQRPFAYTAPSGYKALCTQNLPTPTIGATSTTLAGKYFGVTLRTGGAPSGGTYTTTVDMSNGALLWDKARNQAQNNYLVDSNRGLTSFLQSNSTSAEATQANWYTSFGNGTYSTGSTDWGSSVSLVDWIWAAGPNTTNTAGSITSTVSANTTSGFSVVTFTATANSGSIGHGLGVAPSMIIIKSRNNISNWVVYHVSIGAGNYLNLNTTDAAIANANTWQNTTPTSTVFYSNGPFVSGYTEVAYCFAEVAGYSKFGSYTGNGSADGPMVWTGFRPAYIMYKRTDAISDWGIVDATRNPSNVVGEYLAADLSNAGATYSMLDILSNGFKPRWNDTSNNASGGTYIFMAFASSPFKYALAR